jgi:hypothetical protein
MLSSADPATLQRLANLTDLPLVQTMFFNTSYNFTSVESYAHGVRPELALLIYYPLNRSVSFNPETQSKFVTAMHKLNLSVIPSALAFDKSLFGLD